MEAQERPKRHQEGPQEPPKEAQEPPRRPQERHKSRQESPKSRQDDPKRSQEPPRGPPEASRSHFWLDFRASGDHFRRFWLFEATGNQLAPPRGHRLYRKAAGITAGPPPVSENSLRHRQATACIEKQLAPPPSHRQASDNSSNNICENCFFKLRFPFSL